MSSKLPTSLAPAADSLAAMSVAVEAREAVEDAAHEERLSRLSKEPLRKKILLLSTSLKIFQKKIDHEDISLNFCSTFV